MRISTLLWVGLAGFVLLYSIEGIFHVIRLRRIIGYFASKEPSSLHELEEGATVKLTGVLKKHPDHQAWPLPPAQAGTQCLFRRWRIATRYADSYTSSGGSPKDRKELATGEDAGPALIDPNTLDTDIAVNLQNIDVHVHTPFPYPLLKMEPGTGDHRDCMELVEAHRVPPVDEQARDDPKVCYRSALAVGDEISIIGNLEYAPNRSNRPKWWLGPAEMSSSGEETSNSTLQAFSSDRKTIQKTAIKSAIAVALGISGTALAALVILSQLNVLSTQLPYRSYFAVYIVLSFSLLYVNELRSDETSERP